MQDVALLMVRLRLMKTAKRRTRLIQRPRGRDASRVLYVLDSFTIMASKI